MIVKVYILQEVDLLISARNLLDAVIAEDYHMQGVYMFAEVKYQF